MKGIALDFDGVVHSYTSDWTTAEEIRDPPTPGAIEFIRAALGEFEVTIFSVRAQEHGGREAIHAWLRKHGLSKHEAEDVRITSEKPRAVIYIDDRGFCFRGTFSSLEAIHAFKPWNR
jgi:hypothetical protein